MTTATINLCAKSMVRKAREVNNASRKTKKSVVNAIEFLVLMTLPFLLPFAVMYLTSSNV
jgi:flagellar biosynthesis protein FliP